jgi:hypothetical protein
MEVYYDSHKKLKKTIRQRIAKIKSVSSGNIEIKYFKEEKQIDQFCFEAEIISKKSFQNIYGSGFENNDKNNAIIKYLAKRGEFRGYVFYVKEKPCGYWAGFINHDTFYPLPFGGTGYDPYFKNYSIGTLLMYKMIEDLSCDGKVKYLDFGIMDKKYKKDLCDISWEEISFNIFKPKFKGVCLNILRIFNYYEKIIEKKFKRNKLNFADN